MKKSYLFSQPHQPFFLAGILWAIISMLVFMLSYRGVFTSTVSPLLVHVYSMIFMVFTPFFTGFIFTTFPRFCQSLVVQKDIYVRIFFIFISGSLLFFLGAFVSSLLVCVSIAILFLSHLLAVMQLQKIYNEGSASNASSDTLWILTGFYIGIFVHLLFLVDTLFSMLNYNLSIFNIAATFGFWNYLVFVAFAVAQRMVPFFSHVMVEKRAGFTAVVFAGLLLQTVFIVSELKSGQIIVDVMLGIYILAELYRWKFDTLNSPPILWVLHLALYWIPVALILSVVSVNFLTLHLMAIGFLTTILIGFGTRVTLGHSGQVPHADLYTTWLFYFVQLIVVIRAAFSFFTEQLWLFDISAAAWIMLYLLWIWRYGSVLTEGKKTWSTK